MFYNDIEDENLQKLPGMQITRVKYFAGISENILSTLIIKRLFGSTTMNLIFCTKQTKQQNDAVGNTNMPRTIFLSPKSNLMLNK